MTIRTHTFTARDATVVVREPIGIDRIDQRIIYGKLDYDRDSESDRNRVSEFAEFIQRTVSLEGDMGFPWANLNSSEADVQTAYDAWITWPDDLMKQWIGELWLTTTPESEPGTQPNENPKNEPPPQSTNESK